MPRKSRLPAPPDIAVRDLTPDDWPTVRALFGKNGACGGCWCMYWKVPRGGQLWEDVKGAKNQRAFRRLVTSGEQLGCLAFAQEEPVGWCSVGPRASYPRMERSRVLRCDWDEGTWSVPCFYVPARWRGRGVASALLAGAVDLARRHGARVLEGYPVVPKSAQVPGAFAWTGVPVLFERRGFRDERPSGGPRPIYRLTLRRGGRARR